MKINEFISTLDKIRNKHGNIDVCIWDNLYKVSILTDKDTFTIENNVLHLGL